MKIAPARIESFLRKMPADVVAVLLYGPDSGLVRERAENLVLTIVEDPSDPFRVAEFAAAALRDDPARLADEANAMALTGGRRVVRVREAADGATDVLARFLDDGGGDALVIIEAASLAGGSRLRKLFEGAARAAALPCYGDEGGDLVSIIEETLGARGVVADEAAMAYLCENLGADRMVSRAELEKLALFVGEGATATLDDAVACVGDSAAMTVEDVAFAAGRGDQRELIRKLARAYQEGASPVAVLRVAERHFQRLHFAAGRIAGGARPDTAIGALRPPVFFKRLDDFRGQLRRWPANRIGPALEMLTEAEIQCKSTGLPAQAVCGQVLLRIAAAAGGRTK